MQKVMVEVFSDHVCLFCWLAESEVHELTREDPDVEVVSRAFQLRPEPVPTLDPSGEYLNRIWRDAVYSLAERVGMTIGLYFLPPLSDLMLMTMGL